MSDERGEPRCAAWRDCCPWLMILRSFGLSISMQLLLLAAAGAVLTSASWNLCGSLFPSQASKQSLSELGQWPWKPPQHTAAENTIGLDFPANALSVESGMRPISQVWGQMVRPFLQLFRFDKDFNFITFEFYLSGGLLTILVWAFFGGAITRTASVQLARQQRVGLTESLRFATSKLGSYYAAPLFPLLGVVLIAAPIALVSLLMRLDLFALLGGVLWILVLLGGFLMAVLLLGLLFGWPLMWATISTEGTDSFDALSRSYAYTFQRPLHYLFYALVAALLGALGLLLVSFFSEAVISLSYWSVSWGTGQARLEQLVQGSDPDLGWAGRGGAWMIGFWAGGVRTIATGFVYSYFWVATSAIYLLLRRDVDQTETDEVYLEDEDQEFGLPSLATDSAGVPGSEDQPPSTAEGDEAADDRASDIGG